MSTPDKPDEVRRFIFEQHPVRGHWVHLEKAWQSVREHKVYPPAVRELLGQAVCASVLLAATLKFRGSLTLQFQGTGGDVQLLVAQCTHDFRIRAVARYSDDLAHDEPQPDDFHRLVGEEGRVVVTIEASERDSRYQGIVPLTGASLAECLEAYFASSEQLPTRVQLAADKDHAAGLLVQKLPSADEDDDSDEAEASREVWKNAERSVAELGAVELLNLPVEQVLTDHFGEHDVRLFKPQSVQFECRCNPDRVTSILRALGADEVRDVLREQGSVTVTCDYCNRPYRFNAEDIDRLFSPGFIASGPSSIQ